MLVRSVRLGTLYRGRSIVPFVQQRGGDNSIPNRAIVALACCAALLSGCSVQPEGRPVETISVEILRLGDLSVPVPAAMQQGSFEVVDQCLQLKIGSQRYTPVFVGETVFDNADAVVYASGSDLSVPLNVKLPVGGGLAQGEPLSSAIYPIIASSHCRGPYFIVVQ